MKAEVVNPGWVTADAFMAGYGAAQAVPGPLFTFSAYLGAVSKLEPSGITGALICLLGINAAVVGLLLSAFYNPVWTSAILSPKDFALAVVCFLLLAFWKFPSWAVVIFGALIGGLWL